MISARRYRLFFTWSVLAALFSIPFSIKKFLFAFFSYPSEFSSAFFYLTDALVSLSFAGFIAFQGKKKLEKAEIALFGAFLFFSAYSLTASGSAPFGVYSLARLAFAMLFGTIIAFAVREKAVSLKYACIALSASAMVQASIGVLQFFFGRALGLRLLGETSFWEEMGHFTVGGVEYLRGYGTMSHANILAAFLGIGILAFLGWWLSVYRNAGIVRKFIFGSGFSLLFLGITVTFSRSGWISLAAALSFVFIILFMAGKKPAYRNTDAREDFFSAVTPVVLAAAIVFISMQWVIAPRAHLSATEPSVSLRALYNDIGITMFMEKPLGIGIGNQLPHALTNGIFSSFGIVRQADFQPIHNLYLIVAVELGAQGIVMFTTLLGCAAVTALLVLRRSPEHVAPAAMLFFMLVFGLFDHFFWTLEAGRLMFWSVLGIVMGISHSPMQVGPHRSMDRTLASEAGN